MTEIDFRNRSVADWAAAVRSGELRARELVDGALTRIERLDGGDEGIGAFVVLDADRALAEADALDADRAAGAEVGPLAGLPIAVKDVHDVAGWRTTHGSALHADDPVAVEDSAIVARLRRAGAIVVGKTNTPEHGWKADTVNPLFGATRNPWDRRRSVGGSSGGSAAAVAAGMVAVATGSDGGGSIRIPSAACGLPGFKPTLGRIPNAGLGAPDWTFLSTAGPIAATVDDLAFVLDLVVGPHDRDPRALPAPNRSWSEVVGSARLPGRVGWSPTLGYAPVDEEVLGLCRAALARLADAGVDVVEIDGPFTDDPVGRWATVANTCILRALLPHRARWDLMDPGLRAQIEWADEHVTGVDLVRGLDASHELAVLLAPVFAQVDVLLTPTCAGITPLVGQLGTIDGEPEENWVRFTYPFNLTRSPAGTLPVGLTRDGLPVGLQVVGAHLADETVLAAMASMANVLGPLPALDLG